MTDTDLSHILDLLSAFKADLLSSLHCAMPGIIEAYDAGTGTATVVPAIRRRMKDGTCMELPTLESVPVFLPAANASVTAGMTCLLLFMDGCIDGFLSSGTVSDPAENRRHDLSDAIAIPNFREPSP